MAGPFRKAVAEVDQHLPVHDLMLLDERMEQNRWAYSLFGTVFSVFGAIALTLASVGVFALVADSVRRRIPEFGIRLAFGASPRKILRLVFSHALRRVGLGVACFLLAVALVACWLPARRVTRIDPSTALRARVIRKASITTRPLHRSQGRLTESCWLTRPRS